MDNYIRVQCIGTDDNIDYNSVTFLACAPNIGDRIELESKDTKFISSLRINRITHCQSVVDKSPYLKLEISR